MFYDLYLLRRQNEGRFAMAWAAATRGIAHTSKNFGLKKIQDLDIILLCKETMEYLQTQSNDPKKRLSLRMTIFLIRGSILLFNKQVSIFQDELVNFFTKITVPRQIIFPARDIIPTQRDFLTPPTPVIKEKRKRRKPARDADENLAREELLRLGSHSEDAITELKQPIDADERRRTLQLVEEQPLLHVGVTDDLLGDLGIVPMETAPVQMPRVSDKTPSEVGSEKSQLEKIEELLTAEDEQRKVAEKEPKESLTGLKRKKRSVSLEGGPKIIQVEAIVHQPLGEVEKGTLVEATVTEKEAPTELTERMEEIIIAPEERRKDTPEEPKIIEDIRVEEESVGKPPISVREKTVSTRKAVLGQIQQDEILEHPISESDEFNKKKAVLIDKYLRIKFKKPKKFLHLDDYDKMYELKEEFPIDIYNDRILDVNLMNTVMRKFAKKDLIEPPEMVRRGGISSGQSSDVHGLINKLSPFSTPLDLNAGSTPQLLSLSTKKPSTVDRNVHSTPYGVVQSTPFRENIAMPQIQLYDETRIEMEVLMAEHPQREKDNFAPEFLVQQIMSTELEGRPSEGPQVEIERREVEGYCITEPSIRKLELSDEQEARRNIIIQIVKQWNKTQGDLTFNHLIPIPKNKVNAALTFGDLLALSKDGYVKLLAEKESILLKHVEKGRLLQ